ncbi:hypothetical protein DFH09DRAFT_118384 [Mycena vulgaris]|nr:hypothetical protein DFH09DRAFT_118384 [Mycena vulgaris]
MSVCRICGHRDWEQPGQPFSTSSSLAAPRVGPLSIGEQRAALAEIESQITRYKASIQALEKQQRKLETSLSLLVYPILALPIEITSRIFVHCLPVDGRVCPSRSAAPLILAQICRHWRDVALSTCQLWKSMYIYLPFPTPGLLAGPEHGASSLIQTWISRAKGQLISLGLNQESTTISPVLVSLVSRFSGQIQTLDLHPFPPLFRFLCSGNNPFPLLQHLATSRSSHEDMQDLLKDTPSLRELRLRGDNFSLNFFLPLLTHLEITEDISKETFLEILQRFPLLSHFDFALEDDLITDSSIPTTFPRLSSLTLASPTSSFALHLVTFPNLRKLELPSLSAADAVLLFLSRSSCTIDHLVISFKDCGVLYPEDVPKWLQSFPSVVVLEMTACPELDAVIAHLNTASLPRLTDLTLSVTIDPETPDIDYETIIEMMSRRRNPTRAVQLRKFQLDLNLCLFDREPGDVHPWYPGYLAAPALRRLIAEGFDFVVTFEDDNDYHYRWPQSSTGADLVPFFP